MPLLEESQILLQVAQSFTACFTETAGNELALTSEKSEHVDLVVLHGQALTVLAGFTNNAPNLLLMDDGTGLLDTRTQKAVADRFHFLARCTDSESTRASGAIGLSAWYDFINTEGESRFQGGELLSQLCQLLRSKNPKLPSDALLGALSTEAAHWEESIGSKPRRMLLQELLQLLVGAESLAIRAKVACTFAVLALAMHKFHAEPGVTDDRRVRARRAAAIYKKRQDIGGSEVEALLLFGLASIMEHYEVHGLVEEDIDTISAIAEQLTQLQIIGGHRSITIPDILPLSFNVRAYAVDVLVQYLHRPLINGKLRLTDSACTMLLKVVSNRTYVWLNHSHQLVLPVARILQETGPPELHKQCLVAMVEYWHTAPSQLDLKVFLDHDILYRLVSFMSYDNDAMLCTLASSHFDSLTRYLHGSEWSNTTDGARLAIKLMDRIIQEDLFGVFYTRYLHTAATEDNKKFWTEGLHRVAEITTPVSVVSEKLHAYFRANLFRVEGLMRLGASVFPGDEEFKKDKEHAISGIWQEDTSSAPPQLALGLTNMGIQQEGQVPIEGSITTTYQN
ncbi:hypothetical protein BDV93DRAFT_561369 [Ceratobasidium sp. AG-I]|nr:hypothetical protein BDV93DRAFT_561369 [Ceratobasidium sp. AG-I]